MSSCPPWLLPSGRLQTRPCRPRRGRRPAQRAGAGISRSAVLGRRARDDTAAIGNRVLALLQRPEQLALLRADPSHVSAAVDELLRCDSPVSIATWRWAPTAIRLGEAEVPVGSPVFVSPGAANCDPDRLDLDRPDARSHLAFGHGIHRCLGAPQAQAEVETILQLLLERFPGLRLTEPADQLPWRHSRLVRGLEALPVQL
ncbi:cytochrome P450 [Streptomyces sp. NPDC004539]|uniref:cytochrome P450 n=1 Tax=Streptomyces sp. NPDC004539 TaxID=3154280 RepID=UPI0033BA727F